MSEHRHDQARATMNYAMVGGGPGSFIGEVHRKAARLDGRCRLVSGAFSSDAARSAQTGRELGLDTARAHGSWRELITDEQRRREAGDPDRARFVSIVTPNDTHFEIARAALQAGLHVVCDKPFTHTSAQARELADLAQERGLVCVVTYNYTGYPMVRQAAAMIAAGDLGPIRKVFVDYHQGWLATALERTGMKQAAWRTDPARAGLGGALGDIGTHAENLVRSVTGLALDEVCCEARSFVPGRALDDDAQALLRFVPRDGVHATGVLTCSQVCVGEGNNLCLRVYGERGGLTWRQEAPDELRVATLDAPPRILNRGSGGLHERAVAATRLPGGHPEGFLEAFANLYLGAVERIHAAEAGHAPTGLGAQVPTALDGLHGVAFVEACVASRGSWVSLR
jgi:predicted dehydrogenase